MLGATLVAGALSVVSIWFVLVLAVLAVHVVYRSFDTMRTDVKGYLASEDLERQRIIYEAHQTLEKAARQAEGDVEYRLNAWNEDRSMSAC